MIKRKRWTEEEEQYLFSQVRNHQGNLEEAFLLASRKLKRTPSACHMRWYQHMKNQEKYAYCFATVGGKTIINNGKNTSNTVNVVKTKVSIIKKIINFFK